MSSRTQKKLCKIQKPNFDVDSPEDFAYRKALGARIRRLKASKPAESP